MISPYQFGSAPSSDPTDLDSLLAGAGYHVRSSDLRHVADSLELLDSSSSLPPTSFDSHYNPSDLTAWVDSMLDRPPPPPLPQPATCTAHININPHPLLTLESEEDNGVRLVHLLMSAADAVHNNHPPLALSLISDMRLLLTRVSTSFGIGKVAGHFIHALTLRLRLHHGQQQQPVPSSDYEILYHHYYEACPYLKFAHFTANQAILESFDGHDQVHVIDFNLMHGLQWPALIQALALRPGGAPFLRLTGIGPPSPDGRDALREVGLRLADLARSVQVRFAFRGVAANRLDDVKPWMLQVTAGEAVAINSVMQLHKLLVDPASMESVLTWIASLKPKIFTVVEQEADHNKAAFLDRFTEALFYYSTVFDSLEAARAQQQGSAALAEVYLQREICDIVCCEGANRVERHEPLAKWRPRLGSFGFRPVHLGSNAFKQASMLLTLFSGEGYGVDEVDGCLTLGWHARPLISASAWTMMPVDTAAAPESSRFGGGQPEDGNNNNNNTVNGSSSSSSNNSSSNLYSNRQQL